MVINWVSLSCSPNMGVSSLLIKTELLRAEATGFRGMGKDHMKDGGRKV